MNERFSTILLSLVLLSGVALPASPLPIDQHDSKRKVTYAMLGEDATSTHYYFFYSLPEADSLAKVRLLWNGGAQNKPSITDYYLDGSSILIIERSAERQQLATLIKGHDVPFQVVSERRIKSVNEETLIGSAEPGRLSKQERIALSNLIHALSLNRRPIPPNLK